MKIKNVFLTVCMTFAVMNGTAQTWNCGYPNATAVTATLDADGTITVSGRGKMADYESIYLIGTNSPWNAERQQIKKVVIENGVTSIGNLAFLDCTNLADLSIGTTVENIGYLAFMECSISLVDLPDGVKKIGQKAFADGTVKYLVIPESVTDIDYGAFGWNNELTEVSVSWNDPTVVTYGEHIFEEIEKRTVILHVPVGKKAAYKTADEWKDFNIVDIAGLALNLTTSAGTLSPAFSPYVNEYRIIVPQSVENVLLTATPVAGATISGDGNKTLNTGENIFEIEAVKSDVTTVYTVIVTRTTKDYSLDLVSATDVVTGATTVTSQSNELTLSIIDQIDLEYRLTTGIYSGEIPLHFDIENGSKTFDKTVTVEANSIYTLTLHVNVGYNSPSSSFYTTTHMDQYGRPSYLTAHYVGRLGNVVATEGAEILSTAEISFVGDNFRSTTASDLTFVGSGSLTTFIVTFDTQGGNAIASATAVSGGKVVRPADPERSGFTFGGWYKESACTNAWNFATETVTANVTLYAKWTEGLTGVETPNALLVGIYPNPTNDAFTLSLATPGVYSITITDMTGKALLRQTVSNPLFRMDISAYPAGVYLVTVDNGKRKNTMRVIKN